LPGRLSPTIFIYCSEQALKAADKQLEQKYALKAGGNDFDCAVRRVAQVLNIRPDEVTAYGKSPQKVKASALL
jgi:putative transposase